MADICRQLKTSMIYTAHCLQATNIQAIGDDGFEMRHIMFPSGHQNESYVRSYNKDFPSIQKTPKYVQLYQDNRCFVPSHKFTSGLTGLFSILLLRIALSSLVTTSNK